MTTILIKKKDTAGAPTAGDLTNAAGGTEIAVNTATKRIYTKDSGGNVVELGTNPSTIDATTVDTTNLEVTNIKAKDGTASIVLADTTGVATINAAPVLTALTASQAVFTNGSKALVSNAITGTGNVVMSTSPTLVTPALGTPASGVVTNLTGTASININGTVGATTPAAGAFTTLSATGVATFSAGSAAAPAITATGDTNTGIFFPAADTIAFAEGGAEAMRIDSSGNVGIGTSSPVNKLDVVGDNARSAARASTTAGEVMVEVQVSNYWSGPTYTGTSLRQSGSTATGTYAGLSNANLGSLIFQNGSAGLIATNGATPIVLATTEIERMRIDSSGNVGIGTTAPISKFQVKAATNQNLYIAGSATIANSIVIGGINDAASANIPLEFRYGTTAAFINSGVEAVRIDSSGNVGIGETSPVAALHVARTAAAAATGALAFTLTRPGTADSVLSYWSDNYSPNGAAATLKLGSINSTSRSINATGTVNAAGLDYAEYMTKAGDFTVAKGDVVGIDENGKLTNVFADAVSFVVKSTNPSYVGGDAWGVGLEGDELEAARQLVDRIAFSGQVPVNVTGATAGQYIIPVNNNGAIKGQAVSNPTFEQYQIAVGKVIAIEADGRAKIIVKVA